MYVVFHPWNKPFLLLQSFQISSISYNLQTIKIPIPMFHTGTKSRTKWAKMPPKDKYAIVER
jgi:hypothetical protein